MTDFSKAEPLTLDELGEDTVGKSLPIEEALSKAEEKKGRYFVVPLVVE